MDSGKGQLSSGRCFKTHLLRNSLMVQWLGLATFLSLLEPGFSPWWGYLHLLSCTAWPRKWKEEERKKKNSPKSPEKNPLASNLCHRLINLSHFWKTVSSPWWAIISLMHTVWGFLRKQWRNGLGSHLKSTWVRRVSLRNRTPRRELSLRKKSRKKQKEWKSCRKRMKKWWAKPLETLPRSHLLPVPPRRPLQKWRPSRVSRTGLSGGGSQVASLTQGHVQSDRLMKQVPVSRRNPLDPACQSPYSQIDV